MKALSIKQPWASLIAKGIKDVENRTWKTKFRGKVYIHASSKKVDFGNWYDSPLSTIQLLCLPDNGLSLDFEYSAIIGEIEIVDCINDSKSIWSMENHWHWVLKNPVLYKDPILNVKGKLFFWEFIKE